MLDRIQVFHLPKHVTLDGKIEKTRFEQNNYCTGQEYPMKGGAKHTEIQAQTMKYIKKPRSMQIVLLCRIVIPSHMSKPHTVAGRAETSWTLAKRLLH